MPLDEDLAAAGLDPARAGHAARHDTATGALLVAGAHPDLSVGRGRVLADDEDLLRERRQRGLLEEGGVGVGDGHLRRRVGRRPLGRHVGPDLHRSACRLGRRVHRRLADIVVGHRAAERTVVGSGKRHRKPSGTTGTPCEPPLYASGRSTRAVGGSTRRAATPWRRSVARWRSEPSGRTGGAGRSRSAKGTGSVCVHRRGSSKARNRKRCLSRSRLSHASFLPPVAYASRRAKPGRNREETQLVRISVHARWLRLPVRCHVFAR